MKVGTKAYLVGVPGEFPDDLVAGKAFMGFFAVLKNDKDDPALEISERHLNLWVLTGSLGRPRFLVGYRTACQIWRDTRSKSFRSPYLQVQKDMASRIWVARLRVATDSTTDFSESPLILPLPRSSTMAREV